MPYLDLNGLKSLISWLKGELHQHSNKGTLDKITEKKLKAWDNASGAKAFSIQALEASGEYEKLTFIDKEAKKIQISYGNPENPYASVVILYENSGRILSYEACDEANHYEKVTLIKSDFGSVSAFQELREKITKQDLPT